MRFFLMLPCWSIVFFVTAVLGVPTQGRAPTSHDVAHQIGTREYRLHGRATATDYQTYAKSAISHLQTWYNSTSGLYDQQWWNSANVITMLADFQEYFPNSITSITNTVFPNALTRPPKAFGFTNFLNTYYDDEMWWALACIKLYDITKQTQYLDKASSIFEDPKSVWGTATCGGLWWDKKHTQVNAIANALYMTTAAKLANRKPNSPSSQYYLNEAKRAYNWIKNSGLIGTNNLLNDGLDLTTCKSNGNVVFTYNQGVILSGLVEMTWATGDNSYNTLANTIALSAISILAPKGILVENLCEPNACSGDEQQFKGIFARNIQFMVNRATVMPTSTKTTLVNFLKVNADSIWAVDQKNGAVGLVWGGPYQTATVQTQSSGLDALVGAAAVTVGQGIMS